MRRGEGKKKRTKERIKDEERPGLRGHTPRHAPGAGALRPEPEPELEPETRTRTDSKREAHRPL